MQKAWIITVDMGYGHQRAAFPFKDIAFERIIAANSDRAIDVKEKRQWIRFRAIYEILSRVKTTPLIGWIFWWFLGTLEKISPIYPARDLSKPTFGASYLNRLIRKNFAKNLIDYTSKEELPFVTTFFVPALAAAHKGRKNIYCIVTDTDINRIWVPKDPKADLLYYCAPTDHSQRRLIQYGVPPENIFYTGFPLPEENIKTLKEDLAKRLYRLDPNTFFYSKFKEIVKKEIGTPKKNAVPITITYAVGGAGAQAEIPRAFLRSLKSKIVDNKVRINLVAGIRLEVNKYFLELIEEFGLKDYLGKNLNIICMIDKTEYFEAFNKILRDTDVLWTKPSELCFYCALGIPIILTPAIGAHEELNRDWVIKKAAGFVQEDPNYSDEWIFEWVNKGMLAEAAFSGYKNVARFGTENIKKLIFAKDKSKVKLRYF